MDVEENQADPVHELYSKYESNFKYEQMINGSNTYSTAHILDKVPAVIHENLKTKAEGGFVFRQEVSSILSWRYYILL